MSKSYFTTQAVPNTDAQILIRNIVNEQTGKIQESVCGCHKVTPYPVQKAGLAGTQIVYERLPCTTQCLRATIVEREDGKALAYRMDCETNVLELPLQMPKEEKKEASTDNSGILKQ
jgi:hypothetical protein